MSKIFSLINRVYLALQSRTVVAITLLTLVLGVPELHDQLIALLGAKAVQWLVLATGISGVYFRMNPKAQFGGAK